jgi:hypothetical protein
MKNLLQNKIILGSLTVLMMVAGVQTRSLSQVLVTVGTGTSFNDENTYPAPYGNWYWGSRQQYLYRASEMLAAGMFAGLINSIAFNVANVNASVVHPDYVIYMKNSTMTDLGAGYETGLTQVMNPIMKMPVLGWNIFVLNTPFVWDGVSSLVIEVCHQDIDYTENASTYWTTGLGYTASRWYRADQLGVCGSTLTTSNDMNRPNTRFDMSPPNPPACAMVTAPLDSAVNVCPDQTNFSWTPGAGAPASGYRLYLGTDGGGVATPSNLINGLNVGNITTYVNQLQLSDTSVYFWQVVPVNFAGPATGCGIQTFTSGFGVKPGTASVSTNSICAGNPVSLNMSAFTGNIQWQMKTGVTWNNTGSPNTNPLVTSPTVNTEYRAVMSNSSCAGVYSNVLTVNVFSLSQPGNATLSSDSICNGTVALLTLSGHNGSVQWQFFNGTSWVDATGTGNDSSVFSVGPVMTTQYRAQVTNGSCPSVISNVKTLYIVTVSTPVTTDGKRCGPGIVTMSASGPGTMLWYTDFIGGSQVATGPNYSPNLTTSTTYYVESRLGQAYNVGPVNNGFGSQSNVTSTNWGMQFTASSTLLLERVHVFPGNTSGVITVNLRQSVGGPILNSATANITAFTAKTPVDLNFLIQPGTGYRLELSSGSVDLGRNTTGAVYPYTTLGSNLSITGYLNPNPATAGNYLFFYDWVVSSGCKSNRVPVSAVINTPPSGISFSGLAPTYCNSSNGGTLTGVPAGGVFSGLGISGNQFIPNTTVPGSHSITYTYTDANGCSGSASSNTLVIPNPAVPTISQSGNTLISSSGTSNQWYYNGTAIPGATGITYGATLSGNYTVSVTINGCSSTSTTYAFVFTAIENIESGQLVISPNPNRGVFKIQFNETVDRDATITITNVLGQQVYSKWLPVKSGGHFLDVDLSVNEPGIYSVMIKTKEGTQIRKITITN